MTRNLPVRTNIGSFILYDGRLDVFKDKFDVMTVGTKLKALVDDFNIFHPYAAMQLMWPSTGVLLPFSSELSPLVVLYSVLYDTLQPCGYAFRAVSGIRVVDHIPHKYSIIEVPESARLLTLH